MASISRARPAVGEGGQGRPEGPSTPHATPSASTAVGCGDGEERRCGAVVGERRSAHDDGEPAGGPASAARAAMAAGSSAGGALVTTASPGAGPDPPADPKALPEVPAAEAVRREEEEQDRGGCRAPPRCARHGRRADADRRRGGSWWAVRRWSGWDAAGAGCRPAARSRDLRRRCPARCSSSVISTTLRPWPHQRQTTSSTWRDTTSSSSMTRSPPTV